MNELSLIRRNLLGKFRELSTDFPKVITLVLQEEITMNRYEMQS